MKKHVHLIASLLVAMMFSFSALAKEETSALMSKTCDEKKIRELAGDAIVKIEAQDWGAGLKGFTVTINADKMSMKELTEKMQAAKCYE